MPNITAIPVTTNGIQPLMWLDYAFGSIYMLCFVVGLPGNLIAASYFVTRRKDLPTLLYVFTTVTDSALLALSFLPGLCFFFDRKPLLFGYHWFCYVWSLLFHSLQYFSIFLVAVLSLSRTWSLLRPLSHVSKRKVLFCVLVYGVFIVFYRQITQITGAGRDAFTKADVYCWIVPIETSHSKFYAAFQLIGIILLLLPILPITISCAVSTRIVLARRSLTRNSAIANKVKANATITIVLLTVSYIVCNIPLVVNSIIWLYELIKYGSDRGYYSIYDVHVFLKFYFWNFVDVLSVIINCTLNFLIFITRVIKFRKWVVAKLTFYVLRRRTSYDLVTETVRLYGGSHRPAVKQDSFVRFNGGTLPNLKRGSKDYVKPSSLNDKVSPTIISPPSNKLSLSTPSNKLSLSTPSNKLFLSTPSNKLSLSTPTNNLSATPKRLRHYPTI